MKLGVLADSHGNVGAIQRALEIFKNNSIEVILHAGDIGDASQIGLFKNFILHIVKGNGDDLEELIFYASQYNQPVPAEYKLLSFKQKTVYLYHGDKVVHFDEALRLEYMYIIRGHKHKMEDYSVKNSRILNPGALYRASIYSVGILDIENDKWKIMIL